MIRSLAIATVSCVLFLPNAVAETTECTVIDSVPYTITTQGPYCLKANLVYDRREGAAITVQASNVTLDFNGHKLRTRVINPAARVRGVKAFNTDYFVVRNGVLRGFYTGIWVDAGTGHLIEDMVVDKSTDSGIAARQVRSLTIRRNRVMNTGGNSLDHPVHGIFVNTGNSVRLLDNEISNTTRDGSQSLAAHAMLVTADTVVIENNRLSNSADYGITAFSHKVLAANNLITNYPDTGIRGFCICSNDGLYKDNMVAGFSTPYSGGTDGGNNSSIP